MSRINCAKCKMGFHLPDDFERTMRHLGPEGTFYCPAGHPQYFPFGKSDIEKAHEETERLRRMAQREQQQRARWQDEAEAAKRSAAAYKGSATRLKNRARAGVCPCCNRTFENLARHMKAKHPDREIDNVVEIGQQKASGE